MSIYKDIFNFQERERIYTSFEVKGQLEEINLLPISSAVRCK